VGPEAGAVLGASRCFSEDSVVHVDEQVEQHDAGLLYDSALSGTSSAFVGSRRSAAESASTSMQTCVLRSMKRREGRS